jgi:hypothetical protein
VVIDVERVGGVEYAYRNRANSYTVRFGAQVDGTDLVRLESEGKSIAFGPVGSVSSKGVKKINPGSKALTGMTYGESCLTYPETYPGVDLVYEPRTYGIRESKLERPAVA